MFCVSRATFQVLELYPEFAESFSNNLEVTFNLRDVSCCVMKFALIKELLNATICVFS